MWFSVGIASYTFQIIDLIILYFLNISETVEFSSESSSNANEAQSGTVNKDTTLQHDELYVKLENATTSLLGLLRLDEMDLTKRG